MIESRHRRVRSLLALALIAVWMAALASAAAAVTPGMACGGSNMPCCPHSGSALCSSAQCIVQLAQRSESKTPAPAAPNRIQAAPESFTTALPLIRLAVRPPRAGVFRLKEDLRI